MSAAVASATPGGKTVAELERIAMGSHTADTSAAKKAAKTTTEATSDEESAPVRTGTTAKHKKAAAKAAAAKKKVDEAAMKKGTRPSTKVDKRPKKGDKPSTKVEPLANKKVKKEEAKPKKEAKPPMPKITMGTTVYYRTGRVNVSVPSQAFRVFEKAGDKVDKKKKFSSYDSKEECWAACLAIIDAAHK
jgi:hypothetical protein